MTILSSMRSTAFWGVSAPYKNTVAAPASLYAFTSHTFTTAGKVGRYGPSLAQLQSAYSAQSWISNTAYFNQGRSEGYQLWTVPQTGLYRIELAGARGQDSSSGFGYGRGLIMTIEVPLVAGTKLEMVVGQVPGNAGTLNPGNSYAGAGGGTFIAYQNPTNTPLAVAGGGAGLYGSWTSNQAYHDGQAYSIPIWGGNNYGAASGSYQTAGYGGPGYHGGGGGGFYGPGTAFSGRTISDSAMGTDTSGQQYTSGAGFVGTSSGGLLDPVPGTFYAFGGNATALTSEGGFGGGGGGHSGNNSGGGGGGYTGGVGGNTLVGSFLSGIGGGSYVNPSTVTRIVSIHTGQYNGSSTYNGQSLASIASPNTGSGYIIITKL